MRLYSTLIEILKDTYVDSFKANGAILLELQKPDYPVSTVHCKGKAHVYSFDTGNNEVFPFFDKNKPFTTKVCDYVIFYPSKNHKLWIYLVELKSKNPGTVYKQLLNASIFLEYIVTVAKTYSKINANVNIDAASYEIRGVHISTNSRGCKPMTNPKSKVRYSVHSKYGYQYIKLVAGKNIYLECLAV